MLRSHLCDHSDSYMVAKEDITLTRDTNENFIDVRSRLLAFKTLHHLLIAYQRSIMY